MNEVTTITIQDQIKDASLKPELVDLIEVSEPYFALRNVRTIENKVIADVPIQLVKHDENADISLAEVGRHLAILGSLCVANANPQKSKHYYLATDGYFERCCNKSCEATEFIGTATLISINRKVGQVYAELLTPDGRLVFKTTLSYAIISETLFHRLYNSHKKSSIPAKDNNPYKVPIELKNISLSYEKCSAEIGEVKQEQCLGHFDYFPALPVARIGAVLTALSGEHFNYIQNKNSRYCIKTAEIHAKAFIFAGDSIEIESHIQSGKKNDSITIKSAANSNNCKEAATLVCTFY